MCLSLDRFKLPAAEKWQRETVFLRLLEHRKFRKTRTATSDKITFCYSFLDSTQASYHNIHNLW